MKKIEKNNFRLQHMVSSIEKILFLVNDIDFKKFNEDWIIQDAVIRNFEIIGEAYKNVNEEIKQQHPNLDWKQA